MNGDKELSGEISEIKQRLATIEANCIWFTRVGYVIGLMVLSLLGVNIYPLLV